MTAMSITGSFLLLKVLMVHQAKWALKDRRAPKVRKVLRVRSVLKDHKDRSARQVPRDHRATPARPVRQEPPVPKGLRGQQARRDKRLFLRYLDLSP